MNTISIKYINMSLELFGSLLCLIIIICLALSGTMKTRLGRLFMYMLLCNMVLLLSDAVAWGAKGNLDGISYYAVRIANFMVFSLGYLMPTLFSYYLEEYLSGGKGRRLLIMRLIRAVSALGFALVLTSQFNGMYYTIDETNMYRRQELFWLSQALGILIMLMIAAALISHRKRLTKGEFITFMSYIILPTLAMAIQIGMYGIALLYIATTLSLTAIYIGIQTEQARRLQEKELELTESRTAIMLSQIQPHFLYNSLVAIRQLCDLDPGGAKEAVTQFSEYLRGNLDSISQKNVIPFEKEINHIENYLSLEQRRFEDRLSIVYDIGPKDFMLPALTLQPLVENAVRHGVMKKDSGGTVTIKTAESPQCWTITVEDNGVGFDGSIPRDDGRSHIGIQNVRSRLMRMCSGTLEIQSRLGVGTRALITIPKGGDIK